MWLALVFITLLMFCIVFAPLALWPKARPWLWLAMTGMHGAILFVVDFADLSLGMLMIHLFLLDPNWLSQTFRIPFPHPCRLRKMSNASSSPG